jgi:iron complex outermembrane receptor protein
MTWDITTAALTLASGLFISTANAALPQTASSPVSADATGLIQPDDPSNADIVVTANKREQKLNDVGLAISVLQSDDLKRRQISTLSDIANAVPGLIYTNSAENTPVYTLRGVSFYDTSIGGYGAVSLNMDEVPLSFPVLAQHTTYDLERIEVLKGPQGTLFGQNATGGAINFVTAKPTNVFHAGANISYGRFNEVDAEGYVSGPVTDTLSARLSGRLERMDPWQTSTSRPNDRNGRVENYMARLLLDWKPVDGFRLQTNINGWKDNSDTQAAQYIAFQPAGKGRTPALLQYQYAFSPQTPRAADWNPGIPFGDNRQVQGSVRADIDLFSNITLTSLSAYTDYKQHEGTDQDGLPIAEADHAQNDGRIKSFTQEMRVGNGGGHGLRWVLGVNGERSTSSQIINTNFIDSSSHASLGIYTNTYTADQKFTNYAAFGNVEYDLGDHFTVKGGVRYTDSKDVGRSCNFDPTTDPANSGTFFYKVLLGGRFGAYPQGACFIINNQGRTINGVPDGAPGEYVDTLHQHNVSWRAGIDWKPRPGLLVYANVAKGYKAGSFPTATGAYFTSYLPVSQESVMSYEGGIKATLLNRKLQIDASGFYYDYRDKQIRAKTNAAPFGILDVLQNIPRSSIRGFEVSADMRPTSGLTVNVAFTYVDATIDRFVGINGAGLVGDFAGTPIPYTPKYQVTINPDYQFALSERMDAFFGGSFNYRSDALAQIGGATNLPSVVPAFPAAAKINSYGTIDLRAGVTLADERYRFWVFGKNVTNTYYWTNVYNTTDTIERLAGRPATYGVAFSVRY